MFLADISSRSFKQVNLQNMFHMIIVIASSYINMFRIIWIWCSFLLQMMCIMLVVCWILSSSTKLWSDKKLGNFLVLIFWGFEQSFIAVHVNVIMHPCSSTAYIQYACISSTFSLVNVDCALCIWYFFFPKNKSQYAWILVYPEKRTCLDVGSHCIFFVCHE